MFRRIAESVEKLLNLKVALDIGYEPAAEVRRDSAAPRSVIAW